MIKRTTAIFILVGLFIACGPKTEPKFEPKLTSGGGQTTSPESTGGQQGGSEGVGGGDPFASDFRELAIKSLDAAAKNQTQGAKRDTQRLKDLLINPKLIESTDEKIEVDGIEKCARFDRLQLNIKFNRKCWQASTQRSKVRLILHELMGLDGQLDDSTYRYSSLWLRAIEKSLPQITMQPNKQKFLNTTLADAIQAKRIDLVVETIDEGAEVTSDHNRPVAQAVSVGSADIVYLLIVGGHADIEIAMQEAIRTSELFIPNREEDALAVVRTLIELKGNPKTRLKEAYCKLRANDFVPAAMGNMYGIQYCRELIGQTLLEKAKLTGLKKVEAYLNTILK